jgi:hypothetical protein
MDKRTNKRTIFCRSGDKYYSSTNGVIHKYTTEDEFWNTVTEYYGDGTSPISDRDITRVLADLTEFRDSDAFTNGTTNAGTD